MGARLLGDPGLPSVQEHTPGIGALKLDPLKLRPRLPSPLGKASKAQFNSELNVSASEVHPR